MLLLKKKNIYFQLRVLVFQAIIVPTEPFRGYSVEKIAQEGL